MGFTIPNEAAASFPTQAEPDSGDIAAMAAGLARTGVRSGCAVTSTSGLGWASAVGVIEVAGKVITVAAGSGTLTADGSNPRWALILVDNLGVVSQSLGTAGTVPVFPSIPATSTVLAAIWVPTAASSISASNIVDKRVMLAEDRHGYGDWHVGRRVKASRSTYCHLGGPGSNGVAFAADTETTIFDSGDSAKGGTTGNTDPGWIARFALFTYGSTWEWGTFYRLKIYYDGETVPTINTPLAGFFGVWYLGYGYRHNDLTMYNPSTTAMHTYNCYLPIPWSTRCKITITAPPTGTGGMSWTVVESFRGQDPTWTSDRKMRHQWWSRTATDSAGAGYSMTSSDVMSLTSTGSTQAIGDFGPGCRIASSTGTGTSITVTNAAALVRAFPVGTKDPRTGTLVTNTTTALAPDMYCWIEDECVKVTAISGNTLTVTRGQADPITGASTTAVDHAAQKFMTRVQGPGRLHAYFLTGGGGAGSGGYNGTQTWCEGPVWVGVDKNPALASSAVFSGGTEDFFGNGAYGSQVLAIGQGYQGDTGGNEYGNLLYKTNGGGGAIGFFRVFRRDPVYFDYGFQAGSYCGEYNSGAWDGGTQPGTSTFGTSLIWYTEA